MSQRSIAQLIKRQVIHLAPSASVREAAQLMSETHIGALLVMDEGRLAGRAETSAARNATRRLRRPRPRERFRGVLRQIGRFFSSEGEQAAQINGRPASTDVSGFLKIDGLRAALALLDIEADLLALSQMAQVGALHSRDVNVDVLRSVIRRDEAETPGSVEEFYGACGLVL